MAPLRRPRSVRPRSRRSAAARRCRGAAGPHQLHQLGVGEEVDELRLGQGAQFLEDAHLGADAEHLRRHEASRPPLSKRTQISEGPPAGGARKSRGLDWHGHCCLSSHDQARPCCSPVVSPTPGVARPRRLGPPLRWVSRPMGGLRGTGVLSGGALCERLRWRSRASGLLSVPHRHLRRRHLLDAGRRRVSTDAQSSLHRSRSCASRSRAGWSSATSGSCFSRAWRFDTGRLPRLSAQRSVSLSARTLQSADAR